MELNGKRLVVIGGAGLIGSHTVDQLLQHDVKEVLIYDNFVRGTPENLANALKDPRVRINEAGGDITQTDVLENAITGADGVFHFAALWLLQCHEFPRTAFDVNVRGTFNVLDACVRQGVKRLVWSSSASVYGDARTEPMDEDHPYDNKNFYGATKICGEAMARAYHHRYGLNSAAEHPKLYCRHSLVHERWLKKGECEHAADSEQKPEIWLWKKVSSASNG